MKKKITVKDLQDFKGNKKLVCIAIKNIEEALAADKVGFEMLATGIAGKYKNDDGHPQFDALIKMREYAPTAFMHCGAPDTLIPTVDEAKKFSFKMSNIFSFNNFIPVIHPSSFVHPNATVTGNVIIGKNVYIGPGAAIRGDWGEIVIEDGCNVQENCTVHMFPGVTVTLEENAHIGHGAIIHGANIKKNALI